MKNTVHTLLRVFAYLWAAPNTLLGLIAGGLIVLFGGHASIIHGVIEFHGGLLPPIFNRISGFTAMTLGHTILGTCHDDLCGVRTHEHVHVRQYECWGIFFIPAYWLSSAWQLLNGNNAYKDNFFEKQAYTVGPNSNLNQR